MTTPPVESGEEMAQEVPAAEAAAPAAEPEAEQEEQRERPTEARAQEQRETTAPRPREYRGGRPSGRGREGGRRERRFRRPRRKVCAFCVDKVTHIGYKDHARLRDFVSDRGKILKSRMTGTCGRHQRKLARAVKRARQMALLPFVAE